MKPKTCKCGRSGMVHCTSKTCDTRVCTVCKRAFTLDGLGHHEGPILRTDNGYKLISYDEAERALPGDLL